MQNHSWTLEGSIFFLVQNRWTYCSSEEDSVAVKAWLVWSRELNHKSPLTFDPAALRVSLLNTVLGFKVYCLVQLYRCMSCGWFSHSGSTLVSDSSLTVELL